MAKRYDLFISYSRKDFKEVSDFVNMLTERIPTLTCWFDITGIEVGEKFEERIISAIDNSAFVLFALSENSINSAWTKDEVMYAINTGKKILPVLLKDSKLSDGWFLFKFGRIDCIDSTNQLQVEKLLKNLSKWAEKPLINSSKDLKAYNYVAFKLNKIVWIILFILLVNLAIFIFIFFIDNTKGKNLSDSEEMLIYRIDSTYIELKNESYESGSRLLNISKKIDKKLSVGKVLKEIHDDTLFMDKETKFKYNYIKYEFLTLVRPNNADEIESNIENIYITLPKDPNRFVSINNESFISLKVQVDLLLENIDLNTHSHIHKYGLNNTIWLSREYNDMYKHIIACKTNWIETYNELSVESQKVILQKEQMISEVHKEQMIRKYEDMRVLHENDIISKESVPNFSLD